jgi:hypothetical protein
VERPRPKDLLSTPKAKIVVYTALFGDSDRLWSVPPVAALGARYVVFTEKPRREVGLWTHSFSHDRPALIAGTEDISPPTCFWEQRVMKAPYESRKSARYYKTMAHKVLRGVDISIWVDANVRLLISPAVAAQRWEYRGGIVAFQHAVRGCLFEEATTCMRRGIGNKVRIKAQVRAYREAGMPRGWGLASTRCVVRKHTTEIARLNAAWWREVQHYSLRDQISLPFICWKMGLRWGLIPQAVRTNKAFWFIRHGARI